MNKENKKKDKHEEDNKFIYNPEPVRRFGFNEDIDVWMMGKIEGVEEEEK